MSINGWIGFLNVIYIYYLAIKQEGNPAICDNMNGPWGHHAKWHKSDRKKIPYDLTYMWNLKNKNEKTELVDTENRLVVSRGGGGGWHWGGEVQAKWVKVLKRYNLPVIK